MQMTSFLYQLLFKMGRLFCSRRSEICAFWCPFSVETMVTSESPCSCWRPWCMSTGVTKQLYIGGATCASGTSGSWLFHILKENYIDLVHGCSKHVVFSTSFFQKGLWHFSQTHPNHNCNRPSHLANRSNCKRSMISWCKSTHGSCKKHSRYRQVFHTSQKMARFSEGTYSFFFYVFFTTSLLTSLTYFLGWVTDCPSWGRYLDEP